MCIKIMVPARMVLGLARTAEAIHGFWTMKMTPLARETATGNIAAIAVRASAKPSTQPVTAILMEAGSSIQPRNTGAKPIAGTAAIPDYEYASHSMNYGSWSNSSSSQHSRTASCRTCGYSTTDYGNHSYSTGSWSKYCDTQHREARLVPAAAHRPMTTPITAIPMAGGCQNTTKRSIRRTKAVRSAAIPVMSMATTPTPTRTVFAMIAARMSR